MDAVRVGQWLWGRRRRVSRETTEPVADSVPAKLAPAPNLDAWNSALVGQRPNRRDRYVQGLRQILHIENLRQHLEGRLSWAQVFLFHNALLSLPHGAGKDWAV